MEYQSKFKEHLSIYVPPSHYPVEASRFSPETPPDVPSRTVSSWTNASTAHSAHQSTLIHKESRDVETRSLSSPSTMSTRKSRLGKLFWDIRTLVRDKEPEVVPEPEPELPPWPPLNIEKRGCCHDCPCHAVKKQTRWERIKRRVLIYSLILIILYLLGNVIALNTRVFAPQVSTQVGSNAVTTSSVLSTDAQQCVSQFTVDAPSDPSGYPCSTCLPTLQGVPSNFVDGTSQQSQQILDAIQFCGLRSIFETSDSTGQSALKNGNWGQDVKFCAWREVRRRLLRDRIR